MIPNPASAQETKIMFKVILQQEKKMKSFSGNNQYYKERDELNKLLIQFLRQDFRHLNKQQLLKLCALTSTYRPVQPFSFLVSCGMLQDLTDQGK